MFDLLAHLTEDADGHEAWDAVLAAAASDGVFTSLGTYDDAALVALVVALADQRGRSVDETLRWFGRAALPVLVDRYPVFAEGHSSVRTFLPTLNHVIHPEVRKLYPGAVTPEFGLHERPDGSIGLEYRSPRQLCALAEGLVLGAADHFGEGLDVSQSACVHRGAECCVLELRFAKAQAPVAP